MTVGVLSVAAALHILVSAAVDSWRGLVARKREQRVALRTYTAPRSRVSVIVPVWNDASVIGPTLESLKLEIGDQQSVEVFVVAGGADGSLGAADRAVRRLDDPEQSWHLLEQAPRGKNAALNLGLQRATGDIIIMLDADTQVETGWLRALCGPVESGEFDAATGSFEPLVWSPASRVFVADQIHAQRIRESVTLFGGGTIAVSRLALGRIGGLLPEDVLVGVDWDLSNRLRSAGCRLGFCPDARVRTAVSHDWADYYRNEVRWRRAYHRVELERFRRQPSWQLLMALGYVAVVHALLVGGWLLLPGVALATGLPALIGLQVWLLFGAWVLVRHASRLLAVACFTGACSWLRHAPAYTVAFLLSAVASLRALSSLRSLTPHFKGSRAAAR